MNKTLLVLFFSLLSPFLLLALTIAEKKAGLSKQSSDLSKEAEEFLTQVNRKTQENYRQLHRLYEQLWTMYNEGACEENFQPLINNVNRIRNELQALQKEWRNVAVNAYNDENYALWHQPETNLEQLIIDYGSLDYVYLMTPEIASIKLSVNSNIPIPRSSWNEMLELILNQNGVGIKQLNPFLRQLYLINKNHSGIRLITNCPWDLEMVPVETRAAFVLTPEPAEVRRAYNFLEKFINPNSTVLYQLGRDILILAQVGEILDLLKLYDFVVINQSEKDYKLISLTKVKAEEMARILSALFDLGEKTSCPPPFISNPKILKGSSSSMQKNEDTNGLKVTVLASLSQALFLVGTKDEIKKAEEVIRNVECQIGEHREKVVFWYTAKHSDPEELASLLEKVYNLLVRNCGKKGLKGMPPPSGPPPGPDPALVLVEPPPFKFPEELYKEDFYQEGGYIVNPRPIEPGSTAEEPPENKRTNFIVDPKTGAIVMVVEAEILPKMKDLIKKLDIPKRMVQIETVLFEKRISKRSSYGLNLLRIGECASNTHKSCLLWNDLLPIGRHKDGHHHDLIPHLQNRGVFEFLLSRKRNDTGIPAFDLIYKFLLNQDDININACPSVLTLNQEKATIAIVDEISINTGIFDVETAKGNTLKDAFTRAQYGITIEITPTIHVPDDADFSGNPDNYITMDTDITFDTVHPGVERNRPDVTRRHINNMVRIPDGQTVIIGGLRRKVTNDKKESVPFIGEIPGIGKLFSTNDLCDDSTEMFIFITPKIVSDPVEDLLRLRAEEVCLRPGDLPEFLACLNEARNYEKVCLMDGTMTMLCGRKKDYYYPTELSPCNIECEGEFSGR